jgi:hypothetical protein
MDERSLLDGVPAITDAVSALDATGVGFNVSPTSFG